VTLTDRLVCAAVSAGHRQPVSERKRDTRARKKKAESPKQELQVECTTICVRQTEDNLFITASSSC